MAIDPSLCIADVNVQLKLTHACTRDLRIELLGPGHSFRGNMHRESESRHHGQGSPDAGSSAAEGECHCGLFSVVCLVWFVHCGLFSVFV